jgi:hypothetical protein
LCWPPTWGWLSPDNVQAVRHRAESRRCDPTTAQRLQPFRPWIVNRLAALDLNRIDLNSGPLANYVEYLAHENTAKSRAILVEADQVADALGLDDTLLDALSVGLKLE